MAPVTVTGQCELTNRKVTTTEKKDILTTRIRATHAREVSFGFVNGLQIQKIIPDQSFIFSV